MRAISLRPREPLITSSLPGWAGLLVLFLSVVSLSFAGYRPHQTAAMTMLAMFVSIGSLEAALVRRNGGGTMWLASNPGLGGFLQKLLGTFLVVSVLSSAYWVFPEYAGKFYTPFYSAVSEFKFYIVFIFVALTWWECKKDPAPEDDVGYQIGSSVLSLTPPPCGRKAILNFCLGWVIKLYFLPLMFVYFCNYIASISSVLFDQPANVFWKVHDALFLIDTGFVCVGYAFSTKLIGTQIRSADKTAAGWLSALVCYQPFWSTIGNLYVQFGKTWTEALALSPGLHAAYGTLIVLVTLPYIWATISFGTRFSNLTHRGIIFAGPYKLHRHPAYVSKLVSFTFLYCPFYGTTFAEISRNMTAFAILCWIYYVRAKTEEANLRSVGPEYDIYARAVRFSQLRLWGRLKSSLFPRNQTQ